MQARTLSKWQPDSEHGQNAAAAMTIGLMHASTHTWRTRPRHRRWPTGRGGRRSGLRHDRDDPATAKHRFALQGAGLLLLFGSLPRRVRGRAGKVSRAEIICVLKKSCPKARSTPARCIPRCVRSGRAAARSAAWRSSPKLVSLDDAPDPELIDTDAAVLDRRWR